MSYADKLGIPYAVLLGEDEAAGGQVLRQDLATGEQVTVTLRRRPGALPRAWPKRTGGCDSGEVGTTETEYETRARGSIQIPSMLPRARFFACPKCQRLRTGRESPAPPLQYVLRASILH